jgi:NAD(P)-dependent dehydrogenase (short-subunit alcohol dehydrogenase family)
MLESVRRAATPATLEDVLTQAYRVSCGSLRSHDLVEGIRAQQVDKDRNPTWWPATLPEVSAAVAFLAGDDNRFITGQTIYVNGDSSMG